MDTAAASSFRRHLRPYRQLHHLLNHSHNRDPFRFFNLQFSSSRIRRRDLHICRSSATEQSGGGLKEPPVSPISSSLGLVLDQGPANSWDSGELGSPVAKRFISDDEERWFMWYHGRPAPDTTTSDRDHDSIGLAISANGIHWERNGENDSTGVVMSRSTDWWTFDIAGVRPSDVIIMSSSKVKAPASVYWLYYTGFNPDEIVVGKNGRSLRSLPGLAMSQDGRHWARIEGEHHSGALLDVGATGEWDSLFVASPKVVYHGPGDLRMYYHSFDTETGCYAIGLARSRDGMQWVKLGKMVLEDEGSGGFDEGGMLNGHVVRNRRDGSYLMAYEGVDASGGRSIGMAWSPDGLKDWRRCGEAILKPSAPGGWDDKDAGSPCLVEMDGVDEWRLYYRGVSLEGRTGIGMAVSDGNGNIIDFRKWGGFPM